MNIVFFFRKADYQRIWNIADYFWITSTKPLFIINQSMLTEYAKNLLATL